MDGSAQTTNGRTCRGVRSAAVDDSALLVGSTGVWVIAVERRMAGKRTGDRRLKEDPYWMRGLRQMFGGPKRTPTTGPRVLNGSPFRVRTRNLMSKGAQRLGRRLLWCAPRRGFFCTCQISNRNRNRLESRILLDIGGSRRRKDRLSLLPIVRPFSSWLLVALERNYGTTGLAHLQWSLPLRLYGTLYHSEVLWYSAFR